MSILFVGCSGPEQKLGRGLSNTCEIVRWGEMRRSLEQDSVFAPPGNGFYGVIHGFDRTLERTGLGICQVATFPLTRAETLPAEPFSPNPTYPESYGPGKFSDAMFDTDTYTGFSGGDVAPYLPGSRFKVFDN